MWYNAEPVQVLAEEHLVNNKFAALFMGTGLGKTAATLAAMCELFRDGRTKAVLVIAPLRVCNFTWPDEMDKWDQFRWLRYANLRTEEGWKALQDRSAHVYLCNYEMLPKLRDKYLKGNRDVAFDAVVFDELTKAKNHNSKRINSVRQYFYKHCDTRWGLTGTPTPNSLLELFAQIRLLDQGKRLGVSFGHFRETYFDKQDFYGYTWKVKPNSKERIYQRVGDIALTLSRQDWLDIPDVFVEDTDVSMPSEVKDMYKELEAELLIMLDDDKELEAQNAAVLVNKLLQMTSGAIYYEVGEPYHNLHTAKIDALCKLVKRIGNSTTLIAYQYRHELDRIKKALPNAVGFKDMPERELLDKWNQGEIAQLLVNPMSMAHGLNMQLGGSNVIWFSLPWSPELYDQTNARLARRGQECETTIHRLVMTGTMDEAVVEALRRKDEDQTALLVALKTYKNAQK